MPNVRLSRKGIIILIALIILALFVAEPLAARAGGAGGSSSRSSSGSSGGGGDGLIFLIYFIFRTIPFPFNILILLAVAFFLFRGAKKGRQSSAVNHIPEPGAPVKAKKGYQEFRHRHPEFDESEFLSKVHTAFMTIQKGWEKKDLGTARRFISDGVYQRFSAQFRMMNILEQTNTLEDLTVRNLTIDDVQTDGVYDIITVAVYASVRDKFESARYKKLNSGGYEEFVEYWSFLRKRSAEPEKADLYGSSKCPSCGGELPADMGDVSRCPFCSRLSNTGEYDWVLSEITQADDRLAERSRAANPERLAAKVRALIEENEDFSVQLLEDRASNAFLRILQARVAGTPEKIRRFVGDDLYQKIAGRQEEGMVYNRLYLNNLFLIAIGRREGRDILALSVKYTFQRVRPDGGKIEIIDPSLTSRTEIILMERDSAVFRPSGSIYSYSCPHCGGELADTADTSCQYCGESLNSTRFDWVVTDLLSTDQWREYKEKNKEAFSYSAEPDLLNSLYKVRDYAFNNILVMIAVDGIFDQREQEFADKIANRWGYDKKRVQGMMAMAASGRLSLRLPDSRKDRQKICRLMRKAAEADATVSPQEEALLAHVESSCA